MPDSASLPSAASPLSSRSQSHPQSHMGKNGRNNFGSHWWSVIKWPNGLGQIYSWRLWLLFQHREFLYCLCSWHQSWVFLSKCHSRLLPLSSYALVTWLTRAHSVVLLNKSKVFAHIFSDYLSSGTEFRITEFTGWAHCNHYKEVLSLLKVLSDLYTVPGTLMQPTHFSFILCSLFLYSVKITCTSCFVISFIVLWNFNQSCEARWLAFFFLPYLACQNVLCDSFTSIAISLTASWTW